MSEDILETFELRIRFPNLDFASTKKTSESDGDYNCIAWAAGEDDRKWWPDRSQQAYWPKGVPRECTLPSFLQAFRTLGYEPCDSGEAEQGFEKIAIYADQSGRPTHAARELVGQGTWTSKLGDWIDISHQLDSLNGTKYGNVVQFLRRREGIDPGKRTVVD